MEARSNVTPNPLPLEIEDSTISIQYQDGRVVTYHGPIEERDATVSATLTYEIHVLVTDGTEGSIVYVNDYDTSDEVLEATGVGRVIISESDSASVYPGVTASRRGERITIEVDRGAVAESVYVFVENQLEEHAYQLV